ncbi:MAG TPA: S-adenosylmethionine decarboxylase [Streptosporangiaceae bacterium]|nr:S-adenosylmethionine decarboxylase [Streptosporangiaceae bacterium]
MPGNRAARGFTDLRRQEAPASMVLYAVDGTVAPGTPVSELAALTGIANTAVRAGDGHILETSHVIFPNGAITLVLILAESHLSIHTWPEQSLIAIDLFSCGAIDGETVIGELVRDLRLEATAVRRIHRGRPGA